MRVLDFGWNWAGPMAAQLLADMGAEVIRVETSKRQDLMRFLDYTSNFFCHNNRSKMSTTINVGSRDGSQIALELVRRSDIVMDNFAAGVMAKNGLAYGDLREAKPDIIAVTMSMAGEEGPRRGMRGFASIATGYSGLELMVGYPDAGVSTGLLPFGLGDVTMLELTERNSHPHWLARGLTFDHSFAGWDPSTIYATPWHLTATPPEVTRATPLLGEHNDYVFRDLLGLDDETIARLTADGVLT